MNEKWNFDSLSEWFGYLCKAIRCFLRGVFKLIYSFIGGIASIMYYLFKVVASFCKREFIASIIIGLMLIGLSVGWISTYTSGKVAMKTVEFQRDSIGYKLDKMMQVYEGSALVIVDNDTLYNAK